MSITVANFMERFVEEFLVDLLKQYPDLCTCDRCKRDIASFALNRLPPKYTTTSLGQLYTKSAVLDSQTRTDIISALILGIKSVQENPRHPVE